MGQDKGKRVVIAGPFDKIIDFACSEQATNRLDKETLTIGDFQRWAMAQVVDQDLVKLKAAGILFGATCHPGSLIMMPAGWMVWESVEEHAYGLRVTVLHKVSKEVADSITQWANMRGQGSDSEGVKTALAFVAACG